MIAGMLPYLQWKFGDNEQKGQIAKWFKPAAQARVANGYWDPSGGVCKKHEQQMLSVATTDKDNLYWAAEKPALDPASPKRKHIQLEEESLDDTISMIKSGLSTKKLKICPEDT